MTIKQHHKFKTVCKLFQAHLLDKYGLTVAIRLRTLSDDGLCSESKPNHFQITIKQELSYTSAIDTLIHELAHAISWDQDSDDHGPHWGLAFSRIYRKWLRINAKV